MIDVTLFFMSVFFVGLSSYYYARYLDYVQEKLPELHHLIFSDNLSVLGRLFKKSRYKKILPGGLTLIYLNDSYDDQISIKYKNYFRITLLIGLVCFFATAIVPN